MATIFPDAGDYDIGFTHDGYHGGTSSSLAYNDREKESQRNMMTMQEARWVGVRKKVGFVALN